MVRVWVYDPELDGCFQSELYGLLYTGIFQRCIVVQDGLLRLYSQTCPDEAGHHHRQV